MKEGDVVLAVLQQSAAPAKVRPALFLKWMPPFQDLLVCGISTQLHQIVKDFDELIGPTDDDYQSSGLKAASIIRLGYLAVLPAARIRGRIGEIFTERHERLLNSLANHLRP